MTGKLAAGLRASLIGKHAARPVALTQPNVQRWKSAMAAVAKDGEGMVSVDCSEP